MAEVERLGAEDNFAAVIRRQSIKPLVGGVACEAGACSKKSKRAVSNLEPLLAKRRSPKRKAAKDCIDCFEAAACRFCDRTLESADCGRGALHQTARSLSARRHLTFSAGVILT